MFKEITMFEFDEFAKNHSLKNLYQTSNYAILKTEEGYDYEYLGYFENSKLVVATMILYKHITITSRYAYAPRGFIMNYDDISLLRDFSFKLKKYVNKKKIVFLKIDPLLIMKELDSKTKNIIYQNNSSIIKTFIDLGYKKLKDNLYFESQLPRFEAVINLKDFDFSKISKNTRNKVNNSLKKGLYLIKGTREDIDIIYNFIKHKNNKSKKYYNDVFKSFDNNDLIDVFLVKVDYEAVMNTAKKNYENELTLNAMFNEMLKKRTTTSNYNKKINSDRNLTRYKNQIMEASKKYSDNELEKYIAGAIVIKTQNKVSIYCSGYDKAYKRFNPNYFLYYSIINYYKDSYNYLELNGITGDFSNNNPYYGLNQFKCGFNPRIYEYIGELDLVINEKVYNKLLVTGKLHKEFDLKS